MKYISDISAVGWRAFILAAVFTVNFSRAQSGNVQWAGSGYAVTERGPDYAIHQKITVEHGTNRVHQYTELATGLNYTNSQGQLVPAVEEIDILPNGGAVANHGRHTVSFPGDIYTGKIEVVTSDGLHLKSRPLAISYDDGTNTVLIGVLTNVSGFVVGSNQVVYPNAFSGLNADVRYTYRKGGFEQDIVLNEQPPAPESFGMNSQTAHLQVLTEFFNPPEPKQTNINPKASRPAVSSDTTLTFGKMKMVRGKAFSIGGSGGDSAQTNRSRLPSAARGNVSVSKSWEHLQGRTFLIEALPVPAIAAQLQQLPVSATVSVNSANPPLHKVSAARLLPPVQVAKVDSTPVQLAKADIKYKSGVVLDYDEIDGDLTDFTFESGTTYYISGDFNNLFGTTTFEGGSVIKYDENNGHIEICSSINNSTDPSYPTILTSMNDDSVGNVISGSNGQPIPMMCNLFDFDANNVELDNFRFMPADVAFYNSMDSSTNIFWNCEFSGCGESIDLQDGQVSLNNVLFDGCSMCVFFIGGNAYPQNMSANHVTTSGSSLVLTLSDPGISYLRVTNSIIFGALESGEVNHIITNDVAVNPSGTIFQTGGNANYYLAIGSPCRDVGTTNIDPSLLAEIHTMSTYAPQDGSYLDTNTPDLGYHYPVNEDSDHDGLPDWWEWQKFGNFDQAGSEDYDGDGYSNLQEYLNGSNPADPANVPFKVFITRPRNGGILP